MQPQSIDTLIHARWIIPVEPARTILPDHALAIDSGRILEILPSATASSRYAAFEEHRLADHALIPGLINSHTHAAMALFRGLADDLPLMQWLKDYIWPAEQRWVSPAFVADGTRLAIAEMILSGTTCFNDMYFFPDITAQSAVEAGMRVSVGLILIDFPTPWARDAGEYLQKGEAVHDEYKDNPLVRTAFAPHAPYTVSDGPLEHIAMLAEELDIPIHMHVHETATEIRQSMEQFGQRPLARLNGLGLLSPRLLAVHMTQLTPAEIGTVAEHGVHVVHCPESNLKLASGLCPAQALKQRGINLALGTDGPASNNDLDMFGEMRSAALLAKAVANDSAALPAHEVLEMATLGGARALDLERELGSLKPGKQADIVAVNLSDPATQPLYDPISQLVYSATRQQVTDVWVQGRQLLKNRELLTLDTERLLSVAREWQARIKGNLRTGC